MATTTDRHFSTLARGRGKRVGFAIADVVMSFAIIATLAMILFPIFARSREYARGASCVSNLANISLALRTYAMDHDMRYPPADNDLGPLWPVYFGNQWGFECPSAPLGLIPMGTIPEPAAPDAEASEDAQASGECCPLPDIDWAADADDADEEMHTTYFYISGSRYDRITAATALAGDAVAWHDQHRNVLRTDGAIQRWTEADYHAAGLDKYSIMDDDL